MMRISLRTISEKDVARTYGWVSNPWYVEEFAGSSAPNEDSHRRYFNDVLNSGGGDSEFLAVLCDDAHIGNAGIKGIASGVGEIWYYIGDESFRGCGLAKEMVAVLVQWSQGLGVSQLCARVLETNVKSRKVLEDNGFVLSKESFGMHKGIRMLRYERNCDWAE